MAARPPDSGLSLSAVPATLATAFADALDRWQREDRVARLWRGDATLWTGADEARWLGWLDPCTARASCAEYQRFAADARAGGVTQVLWAGIGGSALAAQVYAALAPAGTGLPLRVLDTLMPDDLVAAERDLPEGQTLAAFASKSGTTLETQLLMARLTARVPPDHCIALTDPGTPLEAEARARGFARVVLGEAAVGGRYSALTAFGLVAAALSGHDLAHVLASAGAMADRCRANDAGNPGLALGLLLGIAALQGRDKLVLLASPGLAPFAAWIEQLVAESTGKDGKGIIPIVPLALPLATVATGEDRLAVRLTLRGEAAPALLPGAAAIDFVLEDVRELGAEFYRWMFATAVAGSVLGVHPFDQPDVEAAKAAARRFLQTPPVAASAAAPAVSLELAAASGIGAARDAKAALAGLLDSLRAGDHLALLCWLPAAAAPALARLQQPLMAATGAVVSVSFGPRYLHANGQLHKGGPATTACLMLSAAPNAERRGTGEWQDFERTLAAQAAGDAGALTALGRRLVWLRLAAPLGASVPALAVLLAEASGATPA